MEIDRELSDPIATAKFRAEEKKRELENQRKSLEEKVNAHPWHTGEIKKLEEVKSAIAALDKELSLFRPQKEEEIPELPVDILGTKPIDTQRGSSSNPVEASKAAHQPTIPIQQGEEPLIPKEVSSEA
jgi:hypothetical protein